MASYVPPPMAGLRTRFELRTGTNAGTELVGTTNFCGLFPATPTSTLLSATEANVRTKALKATVVRRVDVNVLVNTLGADLLATVRVNDADTTAIITITAGVAGTFSSTNLPQSIALGKYGAIRFDGAASVGSCTLQTVEVEADN